MSTNDGQETAAETTERSGVTCRVYESLKDLELSRDEWDDFVEGSGGDIYSTFDWCRTWWEFYSRNRRLHVVFVRLSGELVGVFPLFAETQWLGGAPLRLIRAVGADHSVTTCNVTIKQGHEDDVVRACMRALEERRVGWDMIHLGPLAGYDKRAERIAGAFAAAMPQARVEYKSHCGFHTVFDLADSYEKYLEGLSKRERSNIRQDDRRIRREYKFSVAANTSEGEVSIAFERFLPLHQELWQAKGRLGHFRDWPDGRAFHDKLVERLGARGRVLVLELKADDEVVASEYCFLFGGRVHWFLSGRVGSETFRKWSLGRVGFMSLVEWAISHGYTSVDGLRGYYGYKLRMGGRLTQQQAVVVTRKSLRVSITHGMFRAGSWVLDTLYYRLWFRRIARWVGVRQGPLRRSWIRSRM